jgi:hypothetical protein
MAMVQRMKLALLLAAIVTAFSLVGAALADDVVPFTETNTGSFQVSICTEPVTVEFVFTTRGTEHLAADGSLTVHTQFHGTFSASRAEGRPFTDFFVVNQTAEFDPSGTLIERTGTGLRYRWSMPMLGQVAQQAGRINELTMEILSGPVYVDPQLEADFRAYSGYTGNLVDILFPSPNPDLQLLFLDYSYCWALGVAP